MGERCIMNIHQINVDVLHIGRLGTRCLLRVCDTLFEFKTITQRYGFETQ